MNKYRAIVYVCLIVGLILSAFGIVQAGINEKINYQGKLTDDNNVAVSDGGKCLKFRLMDSLTAGVELWSEEWLATTTYNATTTSGLFSVLLGSIESLSGVDFNQTLYLEVQYDPGCDFTYEEVFSPRKEIGAVPAAFEAKQLGGYGTSSFAILADDETISGAWTFSATTTLSSGLIVASDTLYVLGDPGFVGINIATPSTELEVSGTITATTFTDGTFSVTGGAITGATGNISMWTNNAGYNTQAFASSTYFSVRNWEIYDGDTLRPTSTATGIIISASSTIDTLDVTTITLPDDALAEADINFVTSCGAGNHLYVSGTDLACEADDDSPSNWQFIGASAIRPTSTVGIIVSASSTFAGDLTVASDSHDSDSLFIDASEGRIGIGTTTLAGLLTVGTTTPALVVDAQGYVGIGTSTPSYLFSVQGQGFFTATTTIASDLVVTGAIKNVATKIVAASDTPNGRARADYVCDGTNDQVEINQAIAVLSPQRSGVTYQGGIVYLLEGTYSIGSTTDESNIGIDITTSSVSLIGSGKSTVLQRTWDAVSNDGVITVGDGGTTAITGVTISDLSINGQKGTYAGTENIGIYFNEYVSQSQIRNNWIHDNDGAGIYIYASGSNYNTDFLIEGNDVRNNDAQGFYMQSASGGDRNYRFTISNNHFCSNADDGIYVGRSRRGIISNNNLVSNSGDGIQVFSYEGVISGNNIKSNSQTGINITTSANNTVTGNYISDNGGADTYSGILLTDTAANNNIISSNYIYDSSGDGYGIRIKGSNNNNYLIGNEILGATFTAEVLDEGVNTTIQHRDQFEIESTLSIGTSTTRYTLDVWGDFAVGTSTDTNIPILFVGSGTGYGKVGIGTTTPAGLFTVGTSTAAFAVSDAGLITINNVTYTFPASQGGANTYLKNDSTGLLTWASVSAGGGSNWQFIGASAIRPTTTVGIIVQASSTIDTLTVTTALNMPDSTIQDAEMDYAQVTLIDFANDADLMTFAFASTTYPNFTFASTTYLSWIQASSTYTPKSSTTLDFVTSVPNLATVGTLTTAAGNVSLWTNDAGYITTSDWTTTSASYWAQNSNVTIQDLTVTYGGYFATTTVTGTSTLASINADSGVFYVDAYADSVGIGTTTPSGLFTVGTSTAAFAVSDAGLITINNVTYTFPASQGGANTYLKNDSTGLLTWASVSAGGGSNWQFIGASAIRPTTTVGIIVQASSTFAGGLSVSTSSPSTALTVVQSSTGNIVDFYDGSTLSFTLKDGGYMNYASTTIATWGGFNDQLIDSMEASALYWTRAASAVTSTETSIVKVGSQSLKITASSTEDEVVRKTFGSSQDWSSYERLAFWIYADRLATSTATTTQLLTFQIYDANNPSMINHNITFQKEDRWQYEEVALDATGTAAYDGVTYIQFRTDFGGIEDINFYIDHIRAYNDTERTAEMFVDKDGALVITGRDSVEIYAPQTGGGNIAGVKVNGAVVELGQPLSVNTGGNVGFDYDLEFLNTGLSQISSEGPLRIIAGDPNHAENLTLTTGNKGDVIVELANASSSFMITQTAYTSTTAFIINSEVNTTSTPAGGIFQIITDVNSDENIVFAINADGAVGIATSTPARKLEIMDPANPQMRITQSASQYAEFEVDATGDLKVTLQGDELIIGDENLEVCVSGSCPAFSLTGTGNLVIEDELYIGGDVDNYVKISDTEIEYKGTARPKRSIILTASGAVTPTSNGAAQTKQTTTTHTYYTLDYDPSTEESAFWHWIMPDSYATGTVDVTFYWYATTTAGNVIWAVSTAGVRADVAEDINTALDNSASTTDAAEAGGFDLATSTISSFSPGWEPGDYIIFKAFREADNTSDTLGGDTYLVQIKVEYAVTGESD